MSLTKAVDHLGIEPNSVARVYTQKYLLQRRNEQGFLVKVETFSRPLSPEEVLDNFGPGY